MSDAPPVAAADNIPLGLASMALAVFLFGLINVAVKWLAADYSIVEILFFRNLFALAPSSFLIWRSGGLATLRTRRWEMHLLRAVLGATSLGLLFWSFDLMPLADAIAISFATPLVLTALAGPVLNERVGLRGWAAVLTGFAGVLLVARPTGDVVNVGALAGIVSAVLFAFAMITIRRMSATESSAAITFYYSLICAGLAGLVLPFDWTAPDGLALLGFAGIGLAGGLGQYFMTRAYALAPASATASVNYTSMIWAIAFGYAIWGELPDLVDLIGITIICLALLGTRRA
jgi:drug/metabolite transporter (DMT)-like permease